MSRSVQVKEKVKVKVKEVKCPGCGALSEWSEANRWRPFCSERCRLIDLGDWAGGSNRIVGDEAVIPPEERH